MRPGQFINWDRTLKKALKAKASPPNSLIGATSQPIAAFGEME